MIDGVVGRNKKEEESSRIKDRGKGGDRETREEKGRETSDQEANMR